MSFALYCVMHLERVKARALDAYQDGLRWRWVQEERIRRQQRRDEAMRLWKAAW